MQEDKLISYLGRLLTEFDEAVGQAVRGYVNMSKVVEIEEDLTQVYSVYFGEHEFRISVDEPDAIDLLTERIVGIAMHHIVATMRSEDSDKEPTERNVQLEEIREEIMSRLPKPTMH